MVLITNTKIDQTVILIGHRVVYSRGAYHNLLAQNQKLASIPRHLSCLGLAAGETKGSSRLISTKDGFIVACGNSTAVQLQHLPVSRIISLSCCEWCVRSCEVQKADPDRSWAQSSWPPRFCALIGPLCSPAGAAIGPSHAPGTCGFVYQNKTRITWMRFIQWRHV